MPLFLGLLGLFPFFGRIHSWIVAHVFVWPHPLLGGMSIFLFGICLSIASILTRMGVKKILLTMRKSMKFSGARFWAAFFMVFLVKLDYYVSWTGMLALFIGLGWMVASSIGHLSIHTLIARNSGYSDGVGDALWRRAVRPYYALPWRLGMSQRVVFIPDGPQTQHYNLPDKLSSGRRSRIYGGSPMSSFDVFYPRSRRSGVRFFI